MFSKPSILTGFRGFSTERDFFPENPASSVSADYSPVTSCQVSRDPMTGFREKLRTDRLTKELTDKGQSIAPTFYVGGSKKASETCRKSIIDTILLT